MNLNSFPFRNAIVPVISAALLLVILTGCESATSSTPEPDPPAGAPPAASPPSGTTSISLGSAGQTSITGGSTSGEASIVVVDQDQLPIDSTNYLNSQNLKVEIGTAVGTSTSTTGSQLASSTTPWTFQDATNVIITFQGGAAGGAISYVMTLDRSGSMSLNDLALMEQSAEEFVRNAGAADEGAIINFASRVLVEQSFTTDSSLLISAIRNPSDVGGFTALYDSIGTGISVAETASNSRRAVICMTDGGENASSTYTSVSSVVSYGLSASVPVYCVGLGLSRGSPADQNLQDITFGTNGLYYHSTTSADLVDLYNKISQTLSSSWSITFRSPVTFVTGTTYAVRVTVSYAGGIENSIILTAQAQ